MKGAHLGMNTSGSRALRGLLRLSMATISAAVVAVAGAFVLYWIGYLLIELRVIRPNIDIDDDAALINIGIAMVGGGVGLVIGAFIGWRASQRWR